MWIFSNKIGVNSVSDRQGARKCLESFKSWPW
jgi:hypothetical protein